MTSINVSRTATTAATSPDGTTPDPGTALSPTITHYQQKADEFSRSFDQLVATIPNLAASHPSTATFVRTHKGVVPLEFLSSSIAAVEEVPELQAVKKLDVAATRDALQFIEAFRPVYNKAIEFANNLEFTMDSLVASSSAGALQSYEITKGVARDPKATKAHAHLVILRRDLGRSGRKRKPAAPKEVKAAA
jgi:hypothetical protein